MEFKNIIAELDNYKDSEEYGNYINGLMTDDRVKAYLNTDNGKKLIQPDLDKYFSKGLETWKSNNLQSIVDEEIKKRYPDTDPKDIELSNLKSQLEEMQKKADREVLRNKALKTATDKGLPVELIDYFVMDDEKATNEAIKAFEKAFKANVSNAVEQKLKGEYIPPTDENTNEVVDGVTLAFRKLNPIY